MNEEGQRTVNEKIKFYFEEINSHDFSAISMDRVI